MRGAPQLGFSTSIRKINSRIFFGVCFLPTCVRALEIILQYERKPAPCHRTTVSSVTTLWQALRVNLPFVSFRDYSTLVRLLCRHSGRNPQEKNGH